MKASILPVSDVSGAAEQQLELEEGETSRLAD